MNIETKNELDRNRSTVAIESEIEPAELEAVATGLPVRSKVKAGAGTFKNACKASTLA